MPRKRKKRSHHHDARGIRPFWSGTITFGLVSVPVDLFPANRRLSVSFRLLDGDGTPLSRRYFCPQDDRAVHPEHIMRGFPIDEDKYVTVRDDELDALHPRKSRESTASEFHSHCCDG